MARARYDSLEGCEIIKTTDMAVLVTWTGRDGSAMEQWIPRSACEGGDKLEEGDTDIIVACWLIEREGLPV